MRIVVLLFSLLFVAQSTLAQDWSLAKEKNGVKVYTRKIDGWGIKEYKVKITAKATLAKVVTMLKDAPGRYLWLHNIIEVREVERPNTNRVCIYSHIDAPWPVSDRDNITEFSFSYPSSTTVRVDMKVIKTHKKAPIYNGIVRIERLEGFWLLKDKGNGYIELTQQCVADPGGSLPDWLVNSAVVDTPYQSMYKLKMQIEK